LLDFGLCFSLESKKKEGIAYLLWKAFITLDDFLFYSLIKRLIILKTDSVSYIAEICRKLDPFRILRQCNKTLSFIMWLENILMQLYDNNLQLQTRHMYVFMGFIILGRSFVLKNKKTGEIETFDVFGSSLRAMSRNSVPEVASLGKEFLDDYIFFSESTKTKEKINLHVIYTVLS
jgi:hypothetical protein